MELKALRAAYRRIEWGGLVALPALYLLLMASGLFLLAVDYVVLSFLFVIMLVFQRSRQPLRETSAAAGKRAGAAHPQPLVDEADAAFLRCARLSAVVGGAAYLVFLWGLDIELRQSLVSGRNSPLIFAFAVAGIAIVAFGRGWALRKAWGPFEREHPQVWSSQTDLDGGRTARYPAAYLEWRAAVAAAEAPP